MGIIKIIIELNIVVPKYLNKISDKVIMKILEINITEVFLNETLLSLSRIKKQQIMVIIGIKMGL